MSHYTVLICISDDEMENEGLDGVLNRKLAPFNENDRVEPYKVYEEGSPDQYWWVESVRRGAEEHRTDAPVRSVMVHGDGMVWRNGHGSVTVAENERLEKEHRQEQVTWAERLGEHPTWNVVVELYNEKFYPNNAMALPGEVTEDEVDTERLHLDEDGRAYTWSTYNPDSKWDWWQVGGRWQRSFKTVPEPDENYLVMGSPGTFGDNGRPNINLDGSLYCDGGQLRFLDLDGMRDERARDRLRKYDTYWKLVKEHGEPIAWQTLVEGIEAVLDGEGRREAIKHARAVYHDQPLIQAAQKLELMGFMGPTVEEIYGMSREDFEAAARVEAVPGYALITLRGEWAAPGSMGWFGMSSESPGEQEAFRVQTNRYLDELPKDNWVVLVDCHI